MGKRALEKKTPRFAAWKSGTEMCITETQREKRTPMSALVAN